MKAENMLHLVFVESVVTIQLNGLSCSRTFDVHDSGLGLKLGCIICSVPKPRFSDTHLSTNNKQKF